MSLQIDVHWFPIKVFGLNSFDIMSLSLPFTSIILNTNAGLISLCPPQNGFDEILPTSISLTDDSYRWFAFGIRTHDLIVLKTVEKDEIEKIYSVSPILKNFAAYFGLNYKRAKSLLEHNGVDFSMQLQAEYRSGMNLRELSEVHGPKQETLSGWLKTSGTQLRNGNERLIDRQDGQRLRDVLSETCSVKKAADAIGVHWKTAKRHLDSDG